MDSVPPEVLLTVRALSRVFRGKLLDFLRDAYDGGKLKLRGELAAFADPARFQAWLSTFKKKSDWVVHAKPPFGGPEQVLRYLARYTHRVAISNGRLLSLEQGRVSFRWRDSKDSNRMKTMTLDAVEFIRRFLLHILPSGFVKIRHFGFLANRNRSVHLDLCHQLMKASASGAPAELLTDQQQRAVERRCPACQTGVLRIVERLSAEALLILIWGSSLVHQIDSS
jgi:Putative transposase